MTRDYTDEESRETQLAQAQWHAGVVYSLLKAHRASGASREHQWKVEEALYIQQLEEAQSRLVYLTSSAPAARRQVLASAGGGRRPEQRKRRSLRDHWSRVLALRGRKATRNPSHWRGRS